MDAYERIIAAGTRGIYESNYLKANDPQGQRAFWLKYNALVPVEGTGLAELWAVAFERGKTPIVVKREVAWSEVRADADALCFEAGPMALTPTRATGAIAGIHWDLRLTPTMSPTFTLPHPWMYTGGFPKKKLLTSAPNLVFDGRFTVGGEVWDVSRWIGLRAHNWGTEHAHTYAYGTINTWDGGATDRAVEGFTGRILLSGRPTPTLSGAIGRSPDVAKNRIRHLFGSGRFTADRMEVGWWRPGRGRVHLTMTAEPTSYAGLRYRHPDGRTSYCYNTKFADVVWEADGQRFTSRCGELEVLFPEPLPGIALHPDTSWTSASGDYSSLA